MIEEIIKIAVERNASDIHLAKNSIPTLRIDGELATMIEFPPSTEDDLHYLIKKCSGEEGLKKFFLKKFLDASFHTDTSRFRAHFYYFNSLPGVALRVIPKAIPELSNLKLPPVVRKFVNYPNGLVLVTGQTGSGKTTTLAAIIDEINKTQGKHIITIEDPIEFEYKNKKSMIHQKEVGSDVESFGDALYCAMREDPDIVLVGELRDLDTISNAMKLAETGHLVFGTLHTNNAVETVNRIIAVYPPEQQKQIRVQLAASLRAVIGQQLVPGMFGGRVPLCEIMIVNNAIRNTIREAGQSSAILDQIYSNNKDLGCQTYYQSAAQLVRDRLVAQEAVNQFLEDKDLLNNAMKSSQPKPAAPPQPNFIGMKQR